MARLVLCERNRRCVIAILTRTKISPGQRFELEDYNLLLSSLRTDSKLWHREFFSDQNIIFKGFAVTGLGLTTATIAIDGSTLILPQNTSDFSYFTADAGAAAIALTSSQLTSGVRNFLELVLTNEGNTPLSRVFWDTSLNSGAGGEFFQTVDTVTDVKMTVIARTGGFSGSPEVVPLAIVDVNGSNVITSIFDQRELLGRLAKPGNPTAEYAWGAKVEPVYSLTLTGVTGTFQIGETLTIGSNTAIVVSGGTTAITFNKPTGVNFFPGTSTVTGQTSAATGTIATVSEAFTGADKNLGNMEDMLKAVMTEIKKIKGTEMWYEDATRTLSNIAGRHFEGTTGNRTTGSTGDVVVLTSGSFPNTVYIDGESISFLPDGTNTTGVTVSLDGLTAKAIVKRQAGALVALVAGDLVNNIQARISFSVQGDSWILETPAKIVEADLPTISTAGKIAESAIPVLSSVGKVLDTALSGNVALKNGANTFSKTQTWKKGVDVADAAALVLGDGNSFVALGATNIVSIGTKGVGTVVHINIAVDRLVVHGAGLTLPGDVDVVGKAGDIFTFHEFGVGLWELVGYVSSVLPSGVKVPLDRMSYTETLIANNLLDNSDKQFTITHGLGTDDVFVMWMITNVASGTSDWNANHWFGVLRPDGYFYAAVHDSGIFTPNEPAVPSVGTLAATLRNTSGATRSYKIKIVVFA